MRCSLKQFLNFYKKPPVLRCLQHFSTTSEDSWSSAKPYSAIPGPQPLPIIGNTWRFLKRDILKLGANMRTNFGDVVAIRKIVVFGDVVFLFNVKDIEWMLRNEGPYPMRDGLKSIDDYRQGIRKDLFGDTYGLLNGQMEKWGTFRSAVNPIMLQPRVTQQYIPGLNDIADEFVGQVRRLKGEHPLGEMPKTFIHEINKWAFESIVYIALDTRLGCLGPNPSEKSQLAIQHIQNVFKLLEELDFKPTGVLHKKFKTRKLRDYINSQEFFTNLTVDLIHDADLRIKADANYASKPEHEKSVFEKLVAKDKTVALIMTLDMLSAGIDTTGKTSGAALYFLAKNKEAQDKLREELIHLLPSKTTPITKSLLDEAKYLRAVIKETLRMSPISHSTVRKTTKDMVIGGYQVPKQTLILMPNIYLSIGIDEHFDKPAEFRPERWMRTDGKHDAVSAFASLPFGFGPRSCIGRRMANMEMEILIAKMVRNFQFDWRYEDMRFEQKMFYGIADPLRLTLGDVSK